MDLPNENDVVAGAAAGVLATLVMSGWMLAAQRAGFRRAEQPPKRIVEHVLDVAEVRRSRTVDNVLATLAHLGYGATLGVGYRWARRRTRTPGPALLHGIGFGLGVWATNYAGWIPAAGIMPPPQRDHPNRQLTMLVAHVVFGGVLGAAGDPRARGTDHP